MGSRVRIRRYQTSRNGVLAISRVQGRALPPTAEVIQLKLAWFSLVEIFAALWNGRSERYVKVTGVSIDPTCSLRYICIQWRIRRLGP
jgi:hypothetical protein